MKNILATILIMFGSNISSCKSQQRNIEPKTEPENKGAVEHVPNESTQQAQNTNEDTQVLSRTRCSITAKQLSAFSELKSKQLRAESSWLAKPKSDQDASAKKALRALFDKGERNKFLEKVHKQVLSVSGHWKKILISKLGKPERAIVVWRDEVLHVADFLGKATVGEFIDAIVIDENKKWKGGCRCGEGDGYFVFLNDNSGVIELLSFHHFGHLKSDIWPVDADFTHESVPRLKEILKRFECVDKGKESFKDAGSN